MIRVRFKPQRSALSTTLDLVQGRPCDVSTLAHLHHAYLKRRTDDAPSISHLIRQLGPLIVTQSAHGISLPCLNWLVGASFQLFCLLKPSSHEPCWNERFGPQEPSSRSMKESSSPTWLAPNRNRREACRFCNCPSDPFPCKDRWHRIDDFKRSLVVLRSTSTPQLVQLHTSN